ncbi:MAG TPA: retropepsin-like aspartic protease [Chitinophaga sp.]
MTGLLPVCAGQANHPIAVIPFDLAEGDILLKARLNAGGRELHLLFDTGADGMAINGSLADSLGLTVARSQQASVVGGVMNIDISEHNTYHFGNFALPEQNIGIFRNNALHYDGIAGISLARHYIVQVDMDRKVMELYDSAGYTYPAGCVTLPMVLKGGTPMLHVALQAGSQAAEGDFVFDTGARYNLICFGPFVKNNRLLLSGFDPYGSSSTVSMGQASTSFTGYLDHVQVGSFRWEQVPGTLQAFRPGDEQWARMGAGSLGIQLISRWNFVLDLPHHTLCFRPNQSFNAPFVK